MNKNVQEIFSRKTSNYQLKYTWKSSISFSSDSTDIQRHLVTNETKES